MWNMKKLHFIANENSQVLKTCEKVKAPVEIVKKNIILKGYQANSCLVIIMGYLRVTIMGWIFWSWRQYAHEQLNILTYLCRRGGLCLLLPLAEKLGKSPDIFGKVGFSVTVICRRHFRKEGKAKITQRTWRKEGSTVSKVMPAYQEEQVKLSQSNH